MCGIAGIIGLEDKYLIREMANVINHRGPDQEGYYLDNNISLGHKRLSIIDLSERGKQPMINEEGSIIIVYNGEIYNYKSIRNNLITKGHNFITNTDTEVILHAYEEYGTNCLRIFNGMFAFGIWDNNKNILFAARDRSGQKPYYYALKDDIFIFASEMKSIHVTNIINKNINQQSLHEYFSNGYIMPPRTIFSECNKLESGHYLIYNKDNNKIYKNKYWSIDHIKPKNKMHINDYILKLDKLLKDSVKIRLMSDVPIGAFISGGIDSTIIVSKISEVLKENDTILKTFNIAFDESKYDESKYARLVAEKFNTEHYELNVKEDMLSIVPDLVWQYDEPFYDSSCIPTYYVSKMAKKYATVVLSGDGGDELFGGYLSYNNNKIDKLDIILNKLPDNIKKIIYKRLNIISNLSNIYLKGLKELSHMENLDIIEKFIYKQIKLKDHLKIEIFNDNQIKIWKKYRDIDYRNNCIDKTITQDLLWIKTLIDIKSYLPEDIHMKVDKASMLNSLEIRSPFMDYRIIKYSRSLPSSYKIYNNETKFILKKFLERYFNKNFIYRKKRGFNIPLQEWINKIDLENILLGSDSNIKNILDIDKIKKLITLNTKSKSNTAEILWLLLWYELWHKIYINNINNNSLNNEYF